MAATDETADRDRPTLRPRACPDCGDGSATVLARLRADRIVRNAEPSYVADALARLRLGGGTEVPIARCDGCGFVFAAAVLRDDLLQTFYEEVIDPRHDLACESEPARVRAFVGMWCCLLEGHAAELEPGEPLRVLDFGAGYGTFLQVAQAPGVARFGFEPSARRRAHLQSLGVEPLASVEALRERAPFHYILCNQVLEHVPDPGAVLALLRRVLHRQGRLYLSVPHYAEDRLQENLALHAAGGDYPQDLNPLEHLSYFSPTTFRRLVARHRLRVRRWPIIEPSVAGKFVVLGYVPDAAPEVAWTTAILEHAILEPA